MNIPNPRIFILGLALLMIGANFWGFDIYILDEAKNAGCAREMWQRNDLIVPTFNDELRTDKPPFHYYFMMLAYSIFGVTFFGASFFICKRTKLYLLSFRFPFSYISTRRKIKFSLSCKV